MLPYPPMLITSARCCQLQSDEESQFVPGGENLKWKNNYKHGGLAWAVVVAQLAVWSPLTPEYMGSNPAISNFKKLCQFAFQFIFVLFQHKFYKNTVGSSGSRTRIIEKEGKHNDHLITTTALNFGLKWIKRGREGPN